jgi:hypothetical protein
MHSHILIVLFLYFIFQSNQCLCVWSIGCLNHPCNLFIHTFSFLNCVTMSLMWLININLSSANVLICKLKWDLSLLFEESTLQKNPFPNHLHTTEIPRTSHGHTTHKPRTHHEHPMHTPCTQQSYISRTSATHQTFEKHYFYISKHFKVPINACDMRNWCVTGVHQVCSKDVKNAQNFFQLFKNYTAGNEYTLFLPSG